MATPTNAAPGALALLIILVGSASAQLDVDTRLEATPPEDEPEWREGSVDRSLAVELCYGMGGVNLLGGSFIVEITVSAPEWVNATHPESIMVTPPAGPTEAEGCTSAVAINVELQALEGIPGNETFEVQIQLSAEPERDDTGQPTTGNYDTPGDITVPFNVTAVVEPEPIEDDEPPEENGSPALPLVVLLVATTVAVALGRRRT